MSDRKYRAPWPEVILALIGAGLIALGLVAGAGLVGAIGIPLLGASLVAVVVTLPLSFLPNRGQIVALIIGIVLVGFGVWYGVEKGEDTAILSPVLAAYVGAALAESAFFTLVARTEHHDV